MTTGGGSRVVVTGASGFIGREIMRLAIETGVKVRGLARTPPVSNEEFVDRCDLLVETRLPRLLADSSSVIHAAGLAHTSKSSYSEWHAGNVEVTRRVAVAAVEAQIPHLVLISSVSVYGSSEGTVRDEDSDCQPIGGYGVSKLAAERAAIHAVRNSCTALTILRLGTVYGESDPGSIGRLIRLLASGYFVWIGKGLNRKTLIYKCDVARAALAVARQEASNVSIFNVGDDPCSVRQLVSAICTILRRPMPRLRVPYGLASVAAQVAERVGRRFERVGLSANAVLKFCSDDAYSSHKFREAFPIGFSVALEEGLRRETNWIARSGKGRARDVRG